MTKFKNNITKSIDNLNILQHDLELVYGDELETNIDNMLINNIDTKSGSNLTYNKTVDSGKLDFDIIGNCEQDGTPTPDNEIPVKAVTDDNNVIVGNNHLNEISNFNEVINGKTFTNTNGVYTIQGYANQTAYKEIVITPHIIKATDKLYLNNDTITNNVALVFKYQDDSISTFAFTSLNREINFTAQVGKNLVAIRIFTNAQYVGNLITFKPLLVTKSQNHTLHLGDLELCKIGDYSDKIVKTATGWSLIKNINKRILNGSETWNGISRFYIEINIPVGTYATLSNYFKGTENWAEHTSTNNTIIVYRDTSWSKGRISINSNYFANTNEFKEWLPTHNLIVYYQLAEPVETPITDTTLIADLDALYNDAVTYQDQTNIITESDSDNAQMLIDAKIFVTEKEV